MSQRSRSRSPHGHRSRSSFDRADSFPRSSSNPDTCMALLFENIPKYWNHPDLVKFVSEKTVPQDLSGSIKFVKMLRNKGACSVLFASAEACRAALEALSGVSYKGTQIHVKLDLHHIDNYTPRKHPEFKEKPMKPPPKFAQNNPGDWEEFETFGLKQGYLNSLNIKPPLVNQVFISNLDPKVTEGKLRDIFGYAGHVMYAAIFTGQHGTDNVMAKVEFDHPVEAVQAISMFHGQQLYGKHMVVQLNRKKASRPDGLVSIGPGLGPGGAPLRGIRNSIELQPFKEYLTQEIEKLKASLHSEKRDENTSAAPSQNNALSSLMGLSNLLNPQGIQQLQGLQTLLGNTNNNALSTLTSFQSQNTGIQPQNTAFQNQNSPFQNQNRNAAFQGPNMPFQGPNSGFQNQNAPFQNQNAPFQNQNAGYQGQNVGFQGQSADYQNPNGGAWAGNNNSMDVSKSVNQGMWTDNADTGYGYNHGDNIQAPNSGFNDKDDSSKEMLMFNNLPQSVTSSALVMKMREVGELKFAELTGGGRAIVRFNNVEDAYRCIKLFDQSKVDGQTIEVKFF